MRPLKLYAVVGPGGAGKTTVGETLAEDGYIVIEAGTIVRDRWKTSALPGETIKDFAERLIGMYGPALYMSEVLEMISEAREQSASAKIALLGLRTNEQIVALESVYPEVVLMGIYASPETRFARVLARHRPDDPTDFEDFLRRDFSELSIGLAKVLSRTTIYVMNDGRVDELRDRVKQAVKSQAAESSPELL